MLIRRWPGSYSRNEHASFPCKLELKSASDSPYSEVKIKPKVDSSH